MEREPNLDLELMSDTSENSLLSDLSSINLNSDSYTIKKIKHNRNRPRYNHEPFLFALAFDVVWNDDTETREPIQNLINKYTQEVNEHVLDIINDYKQTAIDYPRNNRCCIMCINKSIHGMIFCAEHLSEYNFVQN